MGNQLFQFQKAGVDFLRDNLRVILADEMGLGKTIQVLSMINVCPHIERALVVCSAGLKLNWVAEAKSWLRRPFRIQVLSGAKPVAVTGTFVVVNYDILSDQLESLLTYRDSQGRSWDLVVFDEAHYLKNPKASRTKAAVNLMVASHRLVHLTGTPIVNRPAELWTLLRGISSSWGKQKAFEQRYCNGHLVYSPFTRSRRRWDCSGASYIEELRQKLRPILLRRTKLEVLPDLPAKLHQIIELNVPDAYQTLNLETNWWETTRMSPGVVSATAEARRQCGESKVPGALDHIKALLEEKEKVTVFAHHKSVVTALTAGLQSYGVVAITGETPIPHRQAFVKTFQENPKCRVFIGNILAAGVGITLTAADIVVFVELDWVPGNMKQAEDRTHRIGQKNNVLVQYLVAPGVDCAIGKALAQKIAVIECVLRD